MQYHLPDFFFTDLVSTVAFGIVAILLIIVGYVAFDKLTPKLDFGDSLNKAKRPRSEGFRSSFGKSRILFWPGFPSKYGKPFSAS